MRQDMQGSSSTNMARFCTRYCSKLITPENLIAATDDGVFLVWFTFDSKTQSALGKREIEANVQKCTVTLSNYIQTKYE
jgi:hypothetical protein